MPIVSILTILINALTLTTECIKSIVNYFLIHYLFNLQVFINGAPKKKI